MIKLDTCMFWGATNKPTVIHIDCIPFSHGLGMTVARHILTPSLGNLGPGEGLWRGHLMVRKQGVWERMSSCSSNPVNGYPLP